MKPLLVAAVGLLAASGCLAVLFMAPPGRAHAPAPAAAKPAAAKPAAPKGPAASKQAAATVRAFAQAWWSYDWRTGWPGAEQAAARWETPALVAEAAATPAAPAWDGSRVEAHEQDLPQRIRVTLEDQTPGALGFAVTATIVAVTRPGLPTVTVQRDAEIQARLVGTQWRVAAVQE